MSTHQVTSAVGDMEYRRLFVPRETDRATVREVLTQRAEYGDWELVRLRLLTDGSRQVVLRRRRLRPARTLQPVLS